MTIEQERRIIAKLDKIVYYASRDEEYPKAFTFENMIEIKMPYFLRYADLKKIIKVLHEEGYKLYSLRAFENTICLLGVKE